LLVWAQNFVTQRKETGAKRIDTVFNHVKDVFYRIDPYAGIGPETKRTYPETTPAFWMASSSCSCRAQYPAVPDIRNKIS
jgi:hypothetical protein